MCCKQFAIENIVLRFAPDWNKWEQIQINLFNSATLTIILVCFLMAWERKE